MMLLWLAAPPALADATGALAAGLRAVAAQDWDGAAAAVQGAGPVAADLVEWQRLRAGKGTAADYLTFARKRGDWPGLPLLLRMGEATLADAPAALVLDYFAARAPATGAGGLALTRAYAATGQRALAEAEAVRSWLDLSMDAVAQDAFLAEFGAVLADQHARRLDAMIWAGQVEDAARMLPLVPEGWRLSGQARLALLAGRDGVEPLIAAVPPDFAKGAGLAFARFEWRMARKRLDDAAALMVERSTTAARLGRPEAWAADRLVLARRAMAAGQGDLAYELAARHFVQPEGRSAGDYAELEWLAGYVALRQLNDPAAALHHFQRLRVAVRSEISLGRAGYWEGRAHEAMGQPEAAKAAYAFAAEHQTGFYGLLAAERAGLPMDPALAGLQTFPDWNGARFMGSSVLQAGLLLQQAGARDLAERFLTHLAESLGPVELGQLADLALARNEPHLALMVAKQAAEQGVILHRAYYPLAAITDLRLPVPMELALAITRRESEFDPAVVSHAGARGLMQLMPGTARLMAPAVGLPYEVGKLTRDPAYNARLGSAYLAKLRAEFGSSPLLVAAGYNAGPGRPRKWIDAFGDPRAAGVDPVDWIEAVPFTETRTYIMRVTESMLIYRARLAGRAVPIRLTEEMKGG